MPHALSPSMISGGRYQSVPKLSLFAEPTSSDPLTHFHHSETTPSPTLLRIIWRKPRCREPPGSGKIQIYVRTYVDILSDR